MNSWGKKTDKVKREESMRMQFLQCATFHPFYCKPYKARMKLPLEHICCFGHGHASQMQKFHNVWLACAETWRQRVRRGVSQRKVRLHFRNEIHVCVQQKKSLKHKSICSVISHKSSIRSLQWFRRVQKNTEDNEPNKICTPEYLNSDQCHFLFLRCGSWDWRYHSITQKSKTLLMNKTNAQTDFIEYQ